mmetsp:Transcript_50448/g.107444  ORF Transcript_50448/g.107444 Transcript_50448/m.107444 type:complete len:179 (-) Transcript_50448:332-868(-)
MNLSIRKTLQMTTLVVAVAAATRPDSNDPLNRKGGFLRAFNKVAAERDNTQDACPTGTHLCVDGDDNECVPQGTPCPCNDGEVRCGVTETSQGWCSDVCCDNDQGEIYCWDTTTEKYICGQNNQCPSGTRSYENFMIRSIETKGTADEISDFHDPGTKQRSLLTMGENHATSAKMALD